MLLLIIIPVTVYRNKPMNFSCLAKIMRNAIEQLHSMTPDPLLEVKQANFPVSTSCRPALEEKIGEKK